MCGIFGAVLSANSKLNRRTLEDLVLELFRLSESRGKESAGIHIYLPKSRRSWTMKSDQPATTFIRSSTYRKNLDEALNLLYNSSTRIPNQPAVFIAHSRLVTNGSAQRSENNQPVTWGETSVVHNGIIVNVDDIWASQSNLQRQAEVDTEVIAALLDVSLQSEWDSIAAMQRTFTQLKGAASIAWTHAHGMFVGAGTNTGDLFLARLSKLGAYVFASEQFILESALRRVDQSAMVTHVQASRGCVITLHDNVLHLFNLSSPVENGQQSWLPKLPEKCSPNASNETSDRRNYHRHIGRTANESLLRYSERSLAQLRRCTRCVLPETFPFISFDSGGVCNYCHCYVTKYKGVNQEVAIRGFLSKIERYRRPFGRPEVIVPLSGGRDSCYGLHLLKSEFGLNPITFTYDWGMVTDLARRNIARICGELGVQNILVSANIRRKRLNIRRNLSAWLAKPDLGLVPLLMAGDKSFISICNQLRRQTGVDLSVWSACPLENTEFKAGFCGIKPNPNKARIDHLSTIEKIKIAAYYSRSFVTNPRYLNSSLADSAAAFVSYYLSPRPDFVSLYDSIEWNEDTISNTLISSYNFEVSSDTTSTWRIGDGTSAFYNYVFVTAKGFSEFDTFRSNQIREGQMSRDDALRHVLNNNQPRVSGLRWYLDALDLDFNWVINRVNSLDSLGLHQ